MLSVYISPTLGHELNSCFCPIGSVRLANGPTSDQGTVEFFWEGRWNTLCVYYPIQQLATVVCGELGLPTAFAQILTGYYPVSNDTAASHIWWNCNGGEGSLQQCSPSGTDPNWFNATCTGDNLARHATGVSAGWLLSPSIIIML